LIHFYKRAEAKDVRMCESLKILKCRSLVV